MSGEPSGLRVSDWKIAPESPSAAPASTAQSARGSRRSRTMKDAAGSLPTSPLITSPGLMANSPVPMRQQEEEGAPDGERAPDDDRARVDEADHSAGMFRLRTMAMNSGAPTKASISPACSSCGATSTRPITSATSMRTAPSTAE